MTVLLQSSVFKGGVQKQAQGFQGLTDAYKLEKLTLQQNRPGSAENVPHHRNGDAVADDREHQDSDVVPAELPARAVEGQKPRPRSKACDPNHHTGELACV